MWEFIVQAEDEDEDAEEADSDKEDDADNAGPIEDDVKVRKENTNIYS